MAEVGIGVASGVLTFATVIVQIGKSIYTIKNFWDDFQDAPHDLQMLVRELKAYGIVLESIKKDLSQPSFCSALEHNSHASEIFDLCTNAAEGLDLVCKDLSQEPTSSSSRLSRLRKPLRLVRSKAKIEKHKARLQNAIQWLMLSQQFYIMACLRIKPQLAIEKVAPQQLELSSSTQTEAGQLDQESCVCETSTGGRRKNTVTYSRNRPNYWRLTLPSWITSTVLEVGGMRAPGGWDWTLRTFTIVSYKSKVVRLIESGDIKGLQDLFASKQASPTDCVEGGVGLISYAGDPNTMEFLFRQGANLDLIDERFWWGLLNLWNPRSFLPTWRVLSRHVHVTYESTEEALEGVFRYFYGSSEQFLFLQRACFPSFYQWPVTERIQMAIAIDSIYRAHKSEVIRTILKKDVLEAKDFQMEMNSFVGLRTTLLHCVARNVGEIQQRLHVNVMIIGGTDPGMGYGKYGLWQEYLRAGGNIHHTVQGRTPLLAFLDEYGSYWTHEGLWSPAYDLAIKPILEDLQSTGVDLEQFGREEQRMWRSDRAYIAPRRDWKCDEMIPEFLGFEYGPSPEDWHIWASEPTDRFAGEFWDMVERPIEVMPGTWPES